MLSLPRIRFEGQKTTTTAVDDAGRIKWLRNIISHGTFF